MPTFGIAIRAIAARQGARVFRAATRDIQRDATGAAKRVDALNASTKRLGGTFGLIARSAAGFIGSIAAIAGIRSTIKTIADFDESINRARVIMGKTKEEFIPFVNEFKRLAVETRFTATAVGDFGAALAQAGFRGKDFIDVIKPSLDLAANGAIELSKAQTIMIGTLSQWGFASTEATRVANVLTKASFLTAASIDEIAEASRKVAPLALRVGLSFEKTTAITAVLTENIRQAARAGTGFRGVLASLLNPSKQVLESLKAQGISAKDLSILNGTVVEVLENMANQAVTTGEKVKLLGRESIIAGLILESSGDRIRGLSEGFNDLGDFAEETAKKFENTLPGAFRRLVSAVTDAQIALGEVGLLGIMRKTVDFTRDVVLALKGQEDGFINTKKSVLLVKEAILAFVGALALFSTAAIIKGIGSLVLAFNPVTLAIGAAAGAVVILRNETVEVAGITTTVGNIIITVWEEVGRVIKDVFGVLIKTISANFVLLRETRNELKKMQKAGEGAAGMGGFLNIFLATQKAMEEGKPARESVLEFITEFIQLSAGADSASERFTNRLKELNDELKNLTKEKPDFGPGATPFGGPTSDPAATKALEVTKELTAQQQSLIQFTDELGESFADAFGELITGAGTAIDVVKNLVNELAELIIKQVLLQPLANNISTGFANILGGSQGGLNTFAPRSGNPESAFLQGQGPRFGSFTDAPDGASAGTALTTAATTAAGITTTAATTSSSLLTTGLTAASTTFSAAVTTTGASFTAAVAAAGASLVAAATAAGTAMTAGAVLRTDLTAFRTTGAVAAGSLGGGLRGPQLQAFARGGIITGPTIGLAGEGGPEAILPLKRGPSGDLGIEASGSSTIINMNVFTPDANSFRRSQKQIINDARKASVRFA